MWLQGLDVFSSPREKRPRQQPSTRRSYLRRLRHNLNAASFRKTDRPNILHRLWILDGSPSHLVGGSCGFFRAYSASMSAAYALVIARGFSFGVGVIRPSFMRNSFGSGTRASIRPGDPGWPGRPHAGTSRPGRRCDRRRGTQETHACWTRKLRSSRTDRRPGVVVQRSVDGRPWHPRGCEEHGTEHCRGPLTSWRSSRCRRRCR